jgi:hypothetical protein
MDESYQEDPPSAAMATTSSYKIDPNWYVDTGATYHITSDLDRLASGNSATVENQCKSATRQVWILCILVLVHLILLHVLLL